MNCSEFRALLDNYANLNDSDLQRLNSHADECAECRAELEFFDSIMKTAASVSFPEPPEDLPDRINKQIDLMPSGFGRITHSIRVNSKRYAALAACLIVGVTVGLNHGFIEKHLSNDKADGVISTESNILENSSDDAEEDADTVNVPQTTQAPSEQVEPMKEDADTEAAVTEVPKIPQPVLPTAKPVVVKKQSGSTVQPVKRKTPAAKNGTMVKPTEQPASPATAAPVSETEKVNESDAQAQPVQNEPEAQPQPAQPEPENNETYVIPREGYSLPRERETSEPVSQAPSEPSAYSINGGESDTVVAYNESGEDVEDPTGGNRLIVSADDIDTLVRFMQELGFTSSNGGYEAPKAALSTLIVKLEGQKIYYEYIQRTVLDDKVYFKIGVTD